MTDLQKRLYRQSTDITKAVSLTMEQAYTGKGVHVEFERRVSIKHKTRPLDFPNDYALPPPREY